MADLPEADRSEFLSLPERLLGKNPFPPDHPGHLLYRDVLNRTGERYARLKADFLLGIQAEADSDQFPHLALAYVIGVFDLFGRVLIEHPGDPRGAEKFLTETAPQISAWALETPLLAATASFRSDLKLGLSQRLAHWTSEAYRLAQTTTRSREDGSGGGLDEAKIPSKDQPPGRVGTVPVPTAPVADTTKLFTVKEAAERLKVHEDTVRSMGKRGDIEIIRIGKRNLRIKGSEILRLRETPQFKDR